MLQSAPLNPWSSVGVLALRSIKQSRVQESLLLFRTGTLFSLLPQCCEAQREGGEEEEEGRWGEQVKCEAKMNVRVVDGAGGWGGGVVLKLRGRSLTLQMRPAGAGGGGQWRRVG